MSIVRASLRTQRLGTDDNLLRYSPDRLQGYELDFLALHIAQSTTSRPRKPEEDQLGPVWWVVNASPLGDFNISAAANPDVADQASNLNSNKSRELSLLERLPSVPGGQANLHGFCISKDPQARKWLSPDELMRKAKKQLSSWKWSEYCTEHETECGPTQHCKHDFNTAIKAMFYRGRLARLTGLEQPKSERSSYWGERFVRVRETAIMLALAIEDTMQILFDSRSTDPICLRQPWHQAFSIFWTLRCSFHDLLQPPDRYGDIHMSLQRDIIDRNGLPKGPWKADRSEIEAVLGLWSWSLESQNIEHIEGIHLPPWSARSIRRILSADWDMERALRQSQHLNTWREADGDSDIREEWLRVDVSDIDAAQHGGGFLVKDRRNYRESRPTLRCVQNQSARDWEISEGHVYKASLSSLYPRKFSTRKYFGWCNVMLELAPPETKLVVVTVASKHSILLNCAQEIYSTFLAAMTQTVKHIGESSAVKHQGTLTGKASNENIKRIQQALIARGLCDEDAAFACTIPVLQLMGKLKLPDERLDTTSWLADE